MKTFVVLACLLVAINGLPAKPFRRYMHLRPIFPNGRIVGGSQADITDLPHQVALEDSGFLFCGGSIISPNYVLTAAHCTDGSSASEISVRSGTSKLESGGQVTKVAAIAQNPGFDFFEFDYDVSVLKLAAPIADSASSRAIKLRTAEAKAGETATVSGWGTISDGGNTLPSNLRKVDVPVVGRDECNSADSYDGEVTDRMICAGVSGKDSCQGDSGGAISVAGAQVGIVSWGYGCAVDGYPGVYSNVAALKDYIDANSNGEAVWV